MFGAIKTLDEVKADAQRQLEGEMQGDVPFSPERRAQSLGEVGMSPPQQSHSHASDPGSHGRPGVAMPLSHQNIYPQTLILRGKYVVVQRPVGETSPLDCIFELDTPAAEFDRERELVVMRKRDRNGDAAGAFVYYLHRTLDEEAKNFMVPKYRAISIKAFQDLSLKYGRTKSMFGKQHFKVVSREKGPMASTLGWHKILSMVYPGDTNAPLECT
ncbi:uncharacterized protein J7T54_000910 [Emericellopsis cladophorae]|uniref:Uncharacterized protein n=1 Tax=Emericellopsis cladophorae TaxID=2686198 RepID=A0A9Q0BET2_9HYPO|nr:uncharacterized protein J7T54_000910 [Emericellopsis cladophorae]KAI6782767.1 hypothetical protein J7T54_000910 [Emericellopsis cladophorae]